MFFISKRAKCLLFCRGRDKRNEVNGAISSVAQSLGIYFIWRWSNYCGERWKSWETKTSEPTFRKLRLYFASLRCSCIFASFIFYHLAVISPLLFHLYGNYPQRLLFLNFQSMPTQKYRGLELLQLWSIANVYFRLGAFASFHANNQVSTNLTIRKRMTG